MSNGREEVVTHLAALGKNRAYTAQISPDARFVNSMDSGVRVWKLDGPEPAVFLDESPGTFRQLPVALVLVSPDDPRCSLLDFISGRSQTAAERTGVSDSLSAALPRL